MRRTSRLARLGVLFSFALAFFLASPPALAGGGPAQGAGVGAAWVRGGTYTVTVFRGEALGGFSSTSYFSTSAGNIIPFTKGNTLWVGFQTLGAVNSTWEHLFWSTDGGGFAPLTKGFWLTRAGADSGANAGYLTLLAGGVVLYFYNPPSADVTNLAIVWRASDGDLLTTVNGNGQIVSAGPAAVACDSTCSAAVGEANAFGQYLHTMRLLYYATWSREASATEADQYTYTTQSRYAISGAASTPQWVQITADASATQWAQFSDWTGSSTFATRGSAPITYTVAGVPTLTPVAEERVAAVTANTFDSAQAVPQVDGRGVAYTIRRSYADTRYTTTAPIADVESYSTLLALDPQSVTGLYVNGAWVSESAANVASFPYTTAFALGSSGTRAVQVWEGPQILSSPLGGTHLGTFVQAVRFPLLGTDGVTVYTTSFLSPSPVQKVLLVNGDSILDGFYAVPMTHDGLPPLFRTDFPSVGTGSVVGISIGFQSVYNLASTPAAAAATAASFVKELRGQTTNYVVTNEGTNDYGVIQESASNFQTYAHNWLDALYAAQAAAGTPGFTMLWVTPIQRIPPASEGPNSAGSSLPDFRAVIAGLPASYPWLHVIDGGGGSIVSNPCMYSDGVHCLPCGDAQLKVAIKASLGYSIAGGLPMNDNGVPIAPLVAGAAVVALGAVVQRRRCTRRAA